MRDRLAEWGPALPAEGGAAIPFGSDAQIASEAETALVSLGYKPVEASRTIARVLKEHANIEDSQTLIRLALKSMA